MAEEIDADIACVHDLDVGKDAVAPRVHNLIDAAAVDDDFFAWCSNELLAAELDRARDLVGAASQDDCVRRCECVVDALAFARIDDLADPRNGIDLRLTIVWVAEGCALGFDLGPHRSRDAGVRNASRCGCGWGWRLHRRRWCGDHGTRIDPAVIGRQAARHGSASASL
jgi:hypothetical protein